MNPMSQPASTPHYAPRPRGRPPLYEPDALRELVEAAALKVFTTSGRAGASMAAIANEAGISRPALYAAAPSKDELYESLLDREIDRFTSGLLARYQEPASTPRERIRARYRAVIDFADANPLSFAFLNRARADGSIQALRGHSPRRDVVAALTENLRSELDQVGFPTKELPGVLAVLFLSLGEGAAWACTEQPARDSDAIIELVTELTLAVFISVDRRLLEAVDKPVKSIKPRKEK
jgi:AcrR family transcriptional regulator